MITTFSDYIFKLNEGLIKTYDIEKTVRMIDNEMGLMSSYDYNIIINDNNTISLFLYKFHITDNLDLKFNHINSLFINRFGWFPSIMKMENISGMKKITQYDENYLLNNKKYINIVEIIYESKFDLEVKIPNKLYHLSIQEFKNKIFKNGIIPKSKSKLSKHLDRIYVTDNIEYCKLLIPKMIFHYELSKTQKSKINTKWVIYQIDTNDLDIKLYKDPNYENGYYVIDNIPKDNIKIIEEQK
jgi:hypothetical protein